MAANCGSELSNVLERILCFLVPKTLTYLTSPPPRPIQGRNLIVGIVYLRDTRHEDSTHLLGQRVAIATCFTQQALHSGKGAANALRKAAKSRSGRSAYNVWLHACVRPYSMNLMHTPRAASPHHFHSANPSIWSRDPETRHCPKLASLDAGRRKRGSWSNTRLAGPGHSLRSV